MTPAELAELRRLVRLELARRERTASDCQGKQRFPNAQLAMLAASHGLKGKANTYRCVICGGWHVGGNKPRLKRLAEERARAR